MARMLVWAAYPIAVLTTAVALHACRSAPDATDRALVQGLQVAEAALAAGQPDVARKLYQSLVERHPDVPPPRLRLAHITFEQGDFRAAREHFVAVAGMSLATHVQAEAWYGAGRAALSLADGQDAIAHFQRARVLVDDPAEAAWIVNGLAVAATIEADHALAEVRYAEAFELDPENPRIMANYVRLLIESGQIEKAVQMYARQTTSFWLDEDEKELGHLIREHRKD